MGYNHLTTGGVHTGNRGARSTRTRRSSMGTSSRMMKRVMGYGGRVGKIA